MKVYTVSRQDKIDYDFSILETKHGCFIHHGNAMLRLREIAEGMMDEFAEDIKKYSNKEEYPDEDSGALVIDDDSEHGYFAIIFGFQEHYEIHSVYIDDWEVED